ncbi:hypothetical protein LQL77_30405 [Rhodococcus cerastii]|nr:hypothetical protein [Rhodococcus cerastii]
MAEDHPDGSRLQIMRENNIEACGPASVVLPGADTRSSADSYRHAVRSARLIARAVLVRSVLVLHPGGSARSPTAAHAAAPARAYGADGGRSDATAQRPTV